jgi:hypothetical protein
MLLRALPQGFFWAMHSLRREPLTKRNDPPAERRNSASHDFRCNPGRTFKALTASAGSRRSVEKGRKVTHVSQKPRPDWNATSFYTCDVAFGNKSNWPFGSTDEKVMQRNPVNSGLFLVPKRTVERATVSQRANVSTPTVRSSTPNTRRRGRIEREDTLPPAA